MTTRRFSGKTSWGAVRKRWAGKCAQSICKRLPRPGSLLSAANTPSLPPCPPFLFLAPTRARKGRGDGAGLAEDAHLRVVQEAERVARAQREERPHIAQLRHVNLRGER